jgi:hypothetical protein
MQLVQRGCDHQVMSTRRVEQAANQGGTAGGWTLVSKWGHGAGDTILLLPE